MFTLRIDDEVELGLLEERHAGPLFELCDRNRAHIGEWQPWIENIKSPDDTLRFIRQSLNQLSDNNGFQVGIFYRGALAGCAGYTYWNWTIRATEISYWLGQEFTGKGLATRAAHRLVDYSFNEVGLNRVEIQVNPRNLKSRAVPERLGFKQEAILRKVGFIRDNLLDDWVVYGLLKDEWTSQKGAGL